MSQHEFLFCYSSCVALQLLIATGNSPSSSFICHDINILYHDRDLVALDCEFWMLCHDRMFFVATEIPP